MEREDLSLAHLYTPTKTKEAVGKLTLGVWVSIQQTHLTVGTFIFLSVDKSN